MNGFVQSVSAHIQQLGLGVDEQIDERQMTQGRFWVGTGEAMRDVHTSSEEPLLSILNSCWDIPIGRVG